ncbi:ESX secretion-associated protein EspG [Amycolatopsis sp. H20-H5]|uniref:ESX secretion-associated protein EspG n=1 Tax=Amycolatopsis sp. H20-H5 TaxID=3046309 RepID=UPI002DB8FBEE|nr:ESX secretion-associated protein EspG [Amycolatopsis sp. H20-H5]MEC3978801.1 ESX secretion-associated protein EspG [Amycolatopsis sp. H20-H5]
MLREPLELSRETYQTLVRRTDAGDIHPTLVGGEKWYPPDELAQLDGKADAELEGQGWRARDFAEVIALLQRPTVDYYCWAKINGHDITVQTATRGRDAVLAVANEDMLFLYPSRAETAAWDLVASFPDTPPVPKMLSLTCAQGDYEAALNGDAPMTSSSSARDARRAAEWMRAPRIHVGRLYVALREGRERRVRNEIPPYWIDTEQGRILSSVTSPGWLTVAPASTQDLAQLLHQIEAELRK